MSQTTFSGPLASGDRQAGVSEGPNVGLAVLRQSAVIDADDTLVQDATMFLPAESQIVDVFVDVLTAFDSATSADLTLGTASGDDSYLSGIDVGAAGRAAPGYSAAELAAMDNIGTNRTVVATVTSVGQPTEGQVRVTVLYVQTTAED